MVTKLRPTGTVISLFTSRPKVFSGKKPFAPKPYLKTLQVTLLKAIAQPAIPLLVTLSGHWIFLARLALPGTRVFSRFGTIITAFQTPRLRPTPLKPPAVQLFASFR